MQQEGGRREPKPAVVCVCGWKRSRGVRLDIVLFNYSAVFVGDMTMQVVIC